ncbi:hypothetical protein H0H93_012381 [Arthromyces matolae]|nr:hypothetical protein H0H93_012381 [Arthromyces matolae]
MRLLLLVAPALWATLCTNAFYLPGAAPHDYKLDEKVALFVNTLTPKLMNGEDDKLVGPSIRFFIFQYEIYDKLFAFFSRNLIPAANPPPDDYYNPKFRFCQPQEGVIKQPESLGSILFGDRIFNSRYEIKMLNNNRTCQTLCTVNDVTGEEAKFINDRIKEDYELNWLVDGLPAATMKTDTRNGDIFFDQGFNLGHFNPESEEQPSLNNHYDVMFKYHKPTPDTFRIVGVLVWPSSIGGSQHDSTTCNYDRSVPLILSETQNQTIRYTYRVTWNESDTPWATRWDNYLHILDPRIHWFSLINSLVIVVFLCAMVSMVLFRSVSRDISRYNAIDLSEDVQEDWGWKLVHGEVFRSPQNPMILSVMVGNGAQLCAMVAVTLGSADMFQAASTLHLEGWIDEKILSSLQLSYPHNLYGIIGRSSQSSSFSTFASSSRVPLAPSHSDPEGTMLLIVLLWFGISSPLSAIGSYFGSKKSTFEHPTRVNAIPRQIPPGPKYLRLLPAAILGGILPFGAAFIELYYVLTSLFASRAYYAFGFLALTAGVVALTTATVSILFTYFILCAEEYRYVSTFSGVSPSIANISDVRWHWRAFLIGGGSAFWVFAYGLFYWATRLSLDSLSSVVIYLGYLILLTLFDFLATGDFSVHLKA